MERLKKQLEGVLHFANGSAKREYQTRKAIKHAIKYVHEYYLANPLGEVGEAIVYEKPGAPKFLAIILDTAATLSFCGQYRWGWQFQHQWVIVGTPVTRMVGTMLFNFLFREINKYNKANMPRKLTKSERRRFRATFRPACAWRLASVIQTIERPILKTGPLMQLIKQQKQETTKWIKSLSVEESSS